jgi:ankyrin repeat protein
VVRLQTLFFFSYRNQTVLHIVCSAPYGHNPEVINALLSAGARVNQPDAGQQTPLHRAVLHGSRDDVNVLLDYGADPNFFDNMGHSCLHVAAKRKLKIEFQTISPGYDSANCSSSSNGVQMEVQFITIWLLVRESLKV